MTREIATRLLGRLPSTLRTAFARGEREGFDRAVQASELFDRELAQGLQRLEAEHDSPGASRYDLLERAAREALVDEVDGDDVRGRDGR